MPLPDSAFDIREIKNWNLARLTRRSKKLRLLVTFAVATVHVPACNALLIAPTAKPLLVKGKPATTSLKFGKPSSLLEDEGTATSSASCLIEDSSMRKAGDQVDEASSGLQQPDLFLAESTIVDDRRVNALGNNVSISEPGEKAIFTWASMSRREMLKRATVLGFGCLIAAGPVIGSRKTRQQQEQIASSRKAFIRLEPYQHRQKASRPGKKSSNNTTTNLSRINQPSPTTTNTATTVSNASSSAASLKTNNEISSRAKPKNTTSTTMKSPNTKSNATITTATKELAPVNFTKVVAENEINITLKDCSGGCVRVNSTSFQKVKTPEKVFPRFIPKFLQPAPKVVKDIPDSEILFAATIAGSTIEMVRTSLLYPLSTVKTRIQARQQAQLQSKRRRYQKRKLRMHRFHPNSSFRGTAAPPPQLATTMVNHNGNTTKSMPLINNSLSATRKTLIASRSILRTNTTNRLYLRRRLRVLQLNIRRHVAEGNLYAGLVPSLLVSVPATGVYYGVRDVTKRALSVAPGLALDDAAITLLGALIADVASLMVRTPADALAARLQAVAASKPSATSPSSPALIKDKVDFAFTNAANQTTWEKNDSIIDLPVPFGEAGAEGNTTVEPTGVELGSLDRLGVTEPLSLLDFFEGETVFNDKVNCEADNSTKIILENLLANVLPEEFDRQEMYHFNSAGLQRDINVNDLFECVRTKEQSRAGNTSDENGGGKTIWTQPKFVGSLASNLFTKWYVENHQKEHKCLNQSGSTGDIMAMTTFNHIWDPLEKIVVVDDSDSTPPHTETKNKISHEGEGNGELRARSSDEIASVNGVLLEDDIADNNVTHAGSKKSSSRLLEEKEEKQLLKELQEENVYQEDWFRQSLQRLPAIIITDLPYLLSRIALNRIVIHGKVNIGQYEVATIAIAMFCALLTTPFDVVRTRLLVDNEERVDDLQNNLPTRIASTDDFIYNNETILNATYMFPNVSTYGYADKGVIESMICIAKEGDGGVQNLYAGWLERTAYYGIGRAWLDPINLITYIGIRDIVLLKWFD